MTNRLDNIDPAFLRRGRFDHIIEVGMPMQGEIIAALWELLSELPTDDNIDLFSLSEALDRLCCEGGWAPLCQGRAGYHRQDFLMGGDPQPTASREGRPKDRFHRIRSIKLGKIYLKLRYISRQNMSHGKTH